MPKTKLDHIYGSTGGANQQELEALKNQVTSLSNIAAKTNISNVFTGNQTINGAILGSSGYYVEGQSQTLGTMKHQSQKDYFINFIQDSKGFRNYSNLNVRHRYANQTDRDYVTLFQLQFRDTGTGAFIACEGNKLSFINETAIMNVATPTANGQAANKAYVDSKSLPDFTLFQNWTGDFKTQNLQWSTTSTITTTGIYEIKVIVTFNNFSYTTIDTMHIDSLTGRYNCPSYWFNWGSQGSDSIQGVPNSGYFLCYAVDKKLKICKFGQNQPTTNTNVKIYLRKIG